jgi:probable HAF family extracellular repeat protein
LECLESRAVPSSFQGLGEMPGSTAGGSAALGISGDGKTIVGYGWVSSSNQEAFRWTTTGGYQVLGDLGSGTSTADAASFNGSVVVGESPPKGGIFGSFRWTAAQGMTAVPVGFPNAVTDDGTMVAGGNAWWKTSGQTGNFGSCTSNQIPLRMVDLSADGSVAAGAGPGGLDMFGQAAANAYRSTPTGNCQDIDPVFNRNSDASGISADGSTIVGEAQDSQGHYRAFRWTASTGMVDLGTLGGGNLLSNATAVSGNGSVVVGYSLTTTSSASDHAFIWTAKTGMQDLNKVLNPPKGWILQVATDISEDGTVITGYGISPPTKAFPFGEMEPWRGVLSSKWTSDFGYGPGHDGGPDDGLAESQRRPEPQSNVTVLSATAASAANHGLSVSPSSTEVDAPAPTAAPAAPSTIMPGLRDTAPVDPSFAAVAKADQPLSFAGQRTAGITTAAQSGTLPVQPDAARVDPFFATVGKADQLLSLPGHKPRAPKAAENADLDSLSGDMRLWDRA